MKTCRVCSQEKSLRDFYIRTGSLDGLRAECKACCVARSVLRQRSESCAEYRRSYYRRNVEKAKAASRLNYHANRERRRAQGSEWYQRNIIEQRLLGTMRSREWEKNNPERRRIKARRNTQTRRARKRAAFVEVVDPMVVFVRDRWTCGICRLPVRSSEAQLDHVVPLARGGEHSYKNTQCAHASCNARKGARTETAA